MFCGGYGYGNGFSSNFGIFHGFGMFIFFGIIILALYLLFRNNNQSNNNDSLDVLKVKFVQGEISEEEYLSKKNVLKRKW